jgi:dinuclear metal center YbgI/SA1388 family protein
MTVRDLMDAMETVAPLKYAEGWDNVGLLAGDAGAELPAGRPVLLTIDLTERVLDEAIGARGGGGGAVMAYHPPIFEPLKRITAATSKERIVLRAGLSIYSGHTALDAAPGGIADWLCEGVSGGSAGHIDGDCRALEPHAELEGSQEVKLVTFLPRTSVEAVRNALASAGAGRIGRYEVCSFAMDGTGTFYGKPGASPVVGKAGRLESAAESRLEMVCSRAGVALALETLRRFHPYEQPAVDVYPLVGQPERGAGPGRRVVLDQPASLRQIADRVKKFLGVDSVGLAMGPEVTLDARITRIGLCPGSGASLAPAAAADGCELFLTGEMKHHETMAALHTSAPGMSVMTAGHTSTERGYLPRLAEKLGELMGGVEFVVSGEDRDPVGRV